MLVRADVDRLDLAEAVLRDWQTMVKAGAFPTENLRLVENEIANLERYRETAPDRVDELRQKFSELATLLRRQIN